MSENTNKIIELNILGNNSLFNEVDNYIVPLYQRAYSWGKDEIDQLIDDIYDYKEDKYYLGSLIVYKRNDNKYEVIDGQQRLTTLFILLKYLDISTYDNLCFECRNKSNETLMHLNDSNFDIKNAEETILEGKEIIDNKFNTLVLDEKENNIDINSLKEKFINKLNNVVIYRIEVPERTDLNHYFEIMNTRGEQLEQHDILKAKLMSYINENNELNVEGKMQECSAFAMIWDACSDMNGYLQMHFNKEIRDKLFEYENVYIKKDVFKELSNNNNSKTGNNESTIKEIIDGSFVVEKYDFDTTTNEQVRFESIIDFPYFLEHVLKVYIDSKNIVNKETNNNDFIVALDDKKLLDYFDKVIEKGMYENKMISDNKYLFATEFIECLIQCRYLFDVFIIKREHKITEKNDNDGSWSIKYFKQRKKESTISYIKTEFKKRREKEKKYSERNQENTMIQSCLRVSYTSPKSAHWITTLLKVLYADRGNYYCCPYLACDAERIAKIEAKKYLDENESINYKTGVNTPHIVLNYLDYLLWKNKNKIQKESKININADKFNFEFRTSVEHWYPQNPSEDKFDKWDDVDTFGNLCIIQREINSKFSNLNPGSKKIQYEKQIEKGSLKLRIMAALTSDGLEWKGIYKDHEEKMLKLLKDATSTLV